MGPASAFYGKDLHASPPEELTKLYPLSRACQREASPA
ncbi:hypothetical protein TDIS_1138 [Thermosulfurimonas dismutans]|uniref:Uncharacterized protein n=1 Tax=Thermosulfurimonas dismutans TaxID=999894 RepID=A0A179D555_9BACT|nr:hypothetical protein TDIS_1138 [Thermosulfurimonas dismutans]